MTRPRPGRPIQARPLERALVQRPVVVDATRSLANIAGWSVDVTVSVRLRAPSLNRMDLSPRLHRLLSDGELIADRAM